ncbi:hypothetical protein DH2020_026791 [Rehmannia glutinosa]|uniref:R2R3-MYB protein n=1 Tax=Rehmannia glutinosa TaxID=99300 RepID=A0ABR0VWX3_REHGL
MRVDSGVLGSISSFSSSKSLQVNGADNILLPKREVFKFSSPELHPMCLLLLLVLVVLQVLPIQLIHIVAKSWITTSAYAQQKAIATYRKVKEMGLKAKVSCVENKKSWRLFDKAHRPLVAFPWDNETYRGLALAERSSSGIRRDLKLRKGLWSPEEDEKLIKHITKYGHGCWSSVPKLAGLQRCGKSCRLRWINYLRPDLKRGTFSQEEENLIIELHAVLGNRQRGIDPNTHKPLSEIENEEKNSANSKNNNEKKSEGSASELSFIEADNNSNNLDKSKPPGNSLERYPLLENNLPNSTHEFFLNRFVASHETSTTSCNNNKNPDMSGFFSFQNYGPNIGLSMNPNRNLFFNPNNPNKPSEIISDPFTSTLLPSIKNHPISFPSDNNHVGPYNVKFENWDSRTTNVSSTSAELQSNCNFFENNNVFTWASQDCGKPGKEASHVPEDIKWTEYLQTPFLLGNTMHNPGPQELYGSENKSSQGQFGTECSLNAGNWHTNQQQQQSLQATEIYSKHFQAATFGEFS